jgi:hypothetical protein
MSDCDDSVPAGAAGEEVTSLLPIAGEEVTSLLPISAPAVSNQMRKASALNEVLNFVWIPDSAKVWQLAKKIPVDVSEKGKDEDQLSEGLMLETKKFRAKEKCIRCAPIGTDEDMSTSAFDVPEKDLRAYDPSHSLDLNDLATMVKCISLARTYPFFVHILPLTSTGNSPPLLSPNSFFPLAFSQTKE